MLQSSRFFSSLGYAGRWVAAALAVILAGCSGVPERQAVPPRMHTEGGNSGCAGGKILG